MDGKVNLRKDGFEEVIACPLCGSTDFIFFKSATYHLNLLPPISVMKCRNCSLSFLSPRPNLEMRKLIFKGKLTKGTYTI